MLTSSHSTILCPCIALPFPLEGVSAPAFAPPASLGAVARATGFSCSTLTRRQIRWHALGYLREGKTRKRNAIVCIQTSTDRSNSQHRAPEGALGDTIEG